MFIYTFCIKHANSCFRYLSTKARTESLTITMTRIKMFCNVIRYILGEMIWRSRFILYITYGAPNYKTTPPIHARAYLWLGPIFPHNVAHIFFYMRLGVVAQAKRLVVYTYFGLHQVIENSPCKSKPIHTHTLCTLNNKTQALRANYQLYTYYHKTFSLWSLVIFELQRQ